MVDRRFILVVDVEATCRVGDLPSGLHGEIIEIGICVVDIDSISVVDKASILVKPVISQVNEFCTSLTSITQEMVEAGVPLVYFEQEKK